MTKKVYSSPTGLYSIRFGKDLIHEGVEHDLCSALMDHYRKRYKMLKGKPYSWPMEPDKMTVEHFSGNYILKKKK